MEIPEALSDKMRNMAMFCAFLVVVIHCRPQFETGTIAWWVKQFAEGGICRVAVPWFFAASGFLTMAKWRGYGLLISRRLRTLMIPFVVWIVLFWMFLFSMSSLEHLSVNRQMLAYFTDWRLFCSKFGFWYRDCPVLSPLWYVRCLFCLTLAFPILKWGVTRLGRIWLVMMFGMYIFRTDLFCEDIRETASLGPLAVEGLFYYSLGIWFAMRGGIPNARSLTFSVLSLSVGLCMAGILAVLSANGWPENSVVRSLVHSGIKFTEVPFMLVGVWGLMTARRLPTWLVSSSFAIYLIHKFVQVVLKNLWNAGAGMPQYFTMAVVSFAISLGIAVAMHRYMPKTSAVLFGGR